MLPVLPIGALVVALMYFVKPQWFNLSVAIWMIAYFLVWAIARV